MEIKKMKQDFSVCKVMDYSLVNLNAEYSFIGKTDEENVSINLDKIRLIIVRLILSYPFRRIIGWERIKEKDYMIGSKIVF